MDLYGALGIADRIQIGFDLPLVLLQTADNDLPLEAGEEFGVGNLRLVPQVQLFSTDGRPGVDLAFLVDLSLPTGDSGGFQGESFRAEPRVAVDVRTNGGTRVGVNLGYAIREDREVRNLEVRDHLTWSLAADIPIGETILHFVPEIAGELSATAGDRGAEETPIEAFFSGRLFPGDIAMLDFGMGIGAVRGYGVPDWRVFAGVTFSPRDDDRDNDGYKDSEDGCPDDPEDFDDFEDADGCSDPDNDQDGIPDRRDDCPDEPEDFDDFEDENGCPDPDNDQDGILDVVDECPDDPEDIDGFEDQNGCPDPDNDRDAILDADDDCPDDPEDVDGWEDMNGCPDPDNDFDGLLDIDDECMNEPEDFDGFEDEDGCPEDGGGLVQLTCASIEIREAVHFETDSDVIEERSYDLLDQVASVLHAASYVRLVMVEGHTDARGSEEHNLDLSQRRAASVRTYLLAAGVEAARLLSEGYGEMQPVASNEDREGRSLNRRVDFIVVEQDTVCAD
jgi:outer membrane protein OmpA-like peptidoglycan-associated protein